MCSKLSDVDPSSGLKNGAPGCCAEEAERYTPGDPERCGNKSWLHCDFASATDPRDYGRSCLLRRGVTTSIKVLKALTASSKLVVINDGRKNSSNLASITG